MARSIRQERAAKGLCPNCGKEAAPYYLCAECRFKAKIIRVMNRVEKAGALRKERRGRDTMWSMAYWGNDRLTKEDVDGIIEKMRWHPDPKEGDGRLRPRLGKIPVDVEKELFALMTEMARPATIEEIVAAWGRLREKRRTSSAAGDLARIIEAQRKRERKAAASRRLVLQV